MGSDTHLMPDHRETVTVLAAALDRAGHLDASVPADHAAAHLAIILAQAGYALTRLDTGPAPATGRILPGFFQRQED